MNAYIERARNTIKRLWTSTYAILGGLGGYAAGSGLALLGRSKSEAAVSVRPELADVGFWQAMLTRHGNDWLFYHHPDASSHAVAAVVTLIGIGVGHYIGERR